MNKRSQLPSAHLPIDTLWVVLPWVVSLAGCMADLREQELSDKDQTPRVFAAGEVHGIPAPGVSSWLPSAVVQPTIPGECDDQASGCFTSGGFVAHRWTIDNVGSGAAALGLRIRTNGFVPVIELAATQRQVVWPRALEGELDTYHVDVLSDVGRPVELLVSDNVEPGSLLSDEAGAPVAVGAAYWLEIVHLEGWPRTHTFDLGLAESTAPGSGATQLLSFRHTWERPLYVTHVAGNLRTEGQPGGARIQAMRLYASEGSLPQIIDDIPTHWTGDVAWARPQLSTSIELDVAVEGALSDVQGKTLGLYAIDPTEGEWVRLTSRLAP